MIPVLINNPLFRGITPEKLSANLEEISFHTRSYKKGEILARQGDVCNRLVILTKGSVRGEMIDYSGRLIKVEDIAAPRAIAPLFLFGEENRYPVEVTANEPTEVIEIPKTSVLELFRKNEQFFENYMNLSANYARTLSDKLFFMSFKTIRQKIASYLLRLYKQQQQLHITLDRSQQELFRSIPSFVGTRIGTHAGRRITHCRPETDHYPSKRRACPAYPIEFAGIHKKIFIVVTLVTELPATFALHLRSLIKKTN